MHWWFFVINIIVFRFQKNLFCLSNWLLKPFLPYWKAKRRFHLLLRSTPSHGSLKQLLCFMALLLSLHSRCMKDCLGYVFRFNCVSTFFFNFILMYGLVIDQKRSAEEPFLWFWQSRIWRRLCAEAVCSIVGSGQAFVYLFLSKWHRFSWYVWL